MGGLRESEGKGMILDDSSKKRRHWKRLLAGFQAVCYAQPPQIGHDASIRLRVELAVVSGWEPWYLEEVSEREATPFHRGAVEPFVGDRYSLVYYQYKNKREEVALPPPSVRAEDGKWFFYRGEKKITRKEGLPHPLRGRKKATQN